MSWESRLARTFSVARAIYLMLPEDARLWRTGEGLVVIKRPRIAVALAAEHRATTVVPLSYLSQRSSILWQSSILGGNVGCVATMSPKKHYIQYHNTELMGGDLEGNGEGTYTILTNKYFPDLRGSIVWLISGVGTPRQYALRTRFEVDERGAHPSVEPEWKYEVAGDGFEYTPGKRLNEVSWFSRFLNDHQRFSLGFRPVLPEYIPFLERAFKELKPSREASRSRDSKRSTRTVGSLTDPDPSLELEASVRAGALGFGDPETNRRVERAAMNAVTKEYEKRGFHVEDVSAERGRGYDLLCSRHRVEEHVEVKGMGGKDQRFFLTESERRAAEEDKSFRLVLVTLALSPRPKLYSYTGAEFLDRFALAPCVYQARLKEE